MDKIKDYKYQFSSAKSNGEILVVRGDNWTQFKEDVGIARTWLDLEEVKENQPYADNMGNVQGDELPDFVDYTREGFCKEHDIEMKKNKNGKLYHREHDAKTDKTRFCNGYQWGNWQ